MNTATRFVGLLTILVLTACPGADVVECGFGGRFITIEGQEYCAYRPADAPRGDAGEVLCPADVPFLVTSGAFVVCASAEPTPESEELLCEELRCDVSADAGLREDAGARPDAGPVGRDAGTFDAGDVDAGPRDAGHVDVDGGAGPDAVGLMACLARTECPWGTNSSFELGTLEGWCCEVGGSPVGAVFRGVDGEMCVDSSAGSNYFTKLTQTYAVGSVADLDVTISWRRRSEVDNGDDRATITLLGPAGAPLGSADYLIGSGIWCGTAESSTYHCEDERRAGSFPERTTFVDLDRLLSERLTGVRRASVRRVEVFLSTANRSGPGGVVSYYDFLQFTPNPDHCPAPMPLEADEECLLLTHLDGASAAGIADECGGLTVAASAGVRAAPEAVCGGAIAIDYTTGGLGAGFGFDRVLVTGSDALSVDVNPVLTIDAWVYALAVDPSGPTSGPKPTIVAQEDHQYRLWVYDGRIGVTLGTTCGPFNGYRWALDPDPLPLRTWVHVAAVVDATAESVEIYRDGVLRDTATSGACGDGSAPVTSSGGVRIGNTAGNDVFPGYLDAVRVRRGAFRPCEGDADQGDYCEEVGDAS